MIIGFVLLDRGRDGTILQLAQSRADAGKRVAVRDAFPGSRLAAQEVRQLLATHNAARAEAGVGPLVWSGSLALYAQKWADHLASTGCRLEHRPYSGTWKQKYGENLFMGTAGRYSVTDAVAAWRSEKSAYHGEAIDMSNFYAYGHYTQLIWRSTTGVGCAGVECGGNMIVVCNYDPPGNIVGSTPY
ncbi:MAG TPA: hypothetical protein DDZ40_05990 [Deltaproteobacteria bacterium]|nr:hypothetical protein [Deltaproteobacteria bacterium]